MSESNSPMNEAAGKALQDVAFRSALKNAIKSDRGRDDGKLTELGLVLSGAGFALSDDQVVMLADQAGAIEKTLEGMERGAPAFFT